jgi:hypothetical protein
VILRGDQYQARTRGGKRFGLDRVAECGEDAEDRDIRGENSQTNRGDYGKAEKDGHEQRNHGQPTLATGLFI